MPLNVKFVAAAFRIVEEEVHNNEI